MDVSGMRKTRRQSVAVCSSRIGAPNLATARLFCDDMSMRWLLLMLAAAGCAPVVGSVQLVNADIAVNAAESAGAPRYATYEYTMAKEYLKKAREESGYSDFAAARTYADKAIKYAETARARALEVSGTPNEVILPESDITEDATPDAQAGPPRSDGERQPVVPPTLDEDGESR